MKKLLLFFLVIVLFGCSSNPSESDGRNVAMNLIKKTNSEEYLKLNSFKKINAKDAEVMGQKIYTIDYEAEIEILKRATYLGSEWGNGFKASEPSRFFQSKEVGYKNTFKGSFSFQKTENGWLGPDGEIY